MSDGAVQGERLVVVLGCTVAFALFEEEDEDSCRHCWIYMLIWHRVVSYGWGDEGVLAMTATPPTTTPTMTCVVLSLGLLFDRVCRSG